MANLAGFSNFARNVGAVPHVPQSSQNWGTGRHEYKTQQKQRDTNCVPPVPRVPLQNDKGWDEEDWQTAFDERAAILEYDAGMSRSDAEAMARIEMQHRQGSQP